MENGRADADAVWTGGSAVMWIIESVSEDSDDDRDTDELEDENPSDERDGKGVETIELVPVISVVCIELIRSEGVTSANTVDCVAEGYGHQ